MIQQKSKYITVIWQYEKRRQALRKKMAIKYPSWNPKRFGAPAPEEYKEAVKNINRKLQIWRGQLTKINKKTQEAKEIGVKVSEFFGTDIRLCKQDIKQKKLQKLARQVYCKYMMENGFRGVIAADYIGIDNPHSRTVLPSRWRRQFNKSSAENKEIYHRFLNYIQ